VPFSTFLAGVVGLTGFTAAATATAVAGYVTGFPGNTLPVTIPFLATGCDGTNNAVQGTTNWPTGETLAVPLCGNSPGNVGWLDWTPTAGGTSELATAIEYPSNPPIFTPRWYYITSTGNVNSAQVQNALDTWKGKQVFLPIFGETCNRTPANLSNPVGAVDDCAAGGGQLGGNGSNQWYFLVGFAAFDLEQSFINGGDGGLCAANDYYSTGNGATSCLIGKFAQSPAVSQGASVGAGGGFSSSSSPLGVQLIR
jgi:hypothetical protein